MKNIEQRRVIAACYCRLSDDDDQDGTSVSIETQTKILGDYCREHGMEKYMKFPLYKKITTDEKYRDDPYRAENFRIDDDGNMICPNGKKMMFG